MLVLAAPMSVSPVFSGGSGAPEIPAVLFCESLGCIFWYHSTLVYGSESHVRPGGPLFLRAVLPSMLKQCFIHCGQLSNWSTVLRLGGIFRYHSTLVYGSESHVSSGGPLFLRALLPLMFQQLWTVEQLFNCFTRP